MQWAARQHFHHRSALMQTWGVVLLLIACALWVWLGFLLAEDQDMYCHRTMSSMCEVDTDVPKQLTLLGISAPLSVLGAGLLVAGSVRRQTSAHVFEVIEMQKSEERSRQK
ncbi:hypothetical protein OG978_23400 [Streptomyces sp. NBC_01591]|uniref:hypothetical protein n=1 Tax=Streptomyces sp. NBC_01591 TaxID=2975888 RepID=UPI002DD8FFC4|nr:hypothetical protein [Streptomyces sp. NBC_01591]WSD70059.1 hypothetical protein OG978_23400 [Streptomyces sp. NBC_01591]